MFNNLMVTWSKLKVVVNRYTINLMAISIIMIVLTTIFRIVFWFFPDLLSNGE